MEEKRKKHRWDRPKNPIHAICVKCECRRFAQKIRGNKSWIYVQKDSVVDLVDVPSCTPTPSPH